MSKVFLNPQECTRTESNASAYEESTAAVAGSNGSRGAEFCISNAICVILRKVLLLGPNDTEWNDTGFLMVSRSAYPMITKDTFV